MAGPSPSNIEDHAAFTDHTTVFDPDHAISSALLTRLASATASTTSQLCQPFVKSGNILDTTNSDSSIALNSILLDSGAQGSNFLARQVYDQLPSDIKHLSRPTNRVVRLGNSRSLAVYLEVPLTLAIPDSTNIKVCTANIYSGIVFSMSSVLDVLSHDVIIGLIDLIGPYYDLFEDSVISSRKLATTISISNEVNSVTSEVNAFTSATDPNMTPSHCTTIDRIFAREKAYLQQKQTICASAYTTIDLLALQDGSSAETLSNPTHGTVFADDRVESHYDSLASALTHIVPGHIVPPWSRPIDTIAPEELETPDPAIFPDDLAYLSTTHDEARLIYLEDLKTHVSLGILAACPDILDLLTSDVALSVFVPKQWDGIKMEPYHLDIKPGLPAFLRARARPVRDASLKDAKAEFDRMLQFFFI